MSFWLFGNVTRLLAHDTVEGVVVELEQSFDSDGDDLYKPTYEYVVAGETYRYQSRVSYGGLLVPDIGDRRTLLYNPDNPRDVQVRSMLVMLGLPLILLVVPLLILGAMFWASVRRRRRETEIPMQLSPGTTPPWASEVPSQSSWDPPTNHTSVEAMFMGTEPSQMDDKGDVRYRVKARGEIDGTQYRFRSEWLDEDPTLYYMSHGNKVTVHVDPDDPTSYEVELPPTE
ncbi:MAG: DUF3592 domain-containing protein [bacterium]|nr:DUF3592 domain-containing protein [bacterium]